ncbi:gephyrin-like molybdotransferase Glp [Arthrobacter sp. JSM 101049]|uniref:molybdopterin molybdotransferase MoeA n=1 Tax=Arthrobacter sp. JSM 101049 TaxID=929097 RepID=UPI003566B317
MDSSFRRTVEDHRAAVHRLLAPLADRLGTDRLPLADALGRVLAADLPAPHPLPPFDNSQMDGYAVRTADLAAGAPLPVGPPIPAGAVAPPLPAGTAVPIMTGAMLPAGADAVVPIERADPPRFPAPGTGAAVALPAATPAGQFIRAAGSDIAAGSTALAAGTRLGPAQLGLAAALGVGTLAVRRRPRVLVLATGDEVRAPGEPLAPGQIHDANTTLLASLLTEAGAQAIPAGISTDDRQAFAADLAAQLGPAGAPAVDLVVTSGGISQGAYEVVRQAVARHGVDFGSVAMQPGGPQGLGLLELPGAAPTPLLAFPGNPVSGVVSFEILLRPVLADLTGAPDRHHLRPRLTGTLDPPPPGKLQARRAVVTTGHDGGAKATAVGGPGSHLVHALATANALLLLPADGPAPQAGEPVDALIYGDLP